MIDTYQICIAVADDEPCDPPLMRRLQCTHGDYRSHRLARIAAPVAAVEAPYPEILEIRAANSDQGQEP